MNFMNYNQPTTLSYNLVSTTLVISYNEAEKRQGITQQDRQDEKQRHALEEEFIRTGHICPVEKLEILQDRLGGLNPKNFKALVSQGFYNPKIMQIAMCLTDSIFYTPPLPVGEVSANERIKEWLRNLRRIGGESVEGYALSTDLEDANSVFIIKTPRNPIFDLLHEYFVGLQLNRLRRKVPNFTYVFGGFKCSSAILTGPDNREVAAWCNTNLDAVVDYIVYENIAPGISMKEYSQTATFANWLDKYLQVLYALHLANVTSGFTHYDLHFENVLIRKLPKKYSFLYTTERGQEYINTDGVATIIDYGKSNIMYENMNYGISTEKDYGVQPAVFPLHDAYKLLCFCMLSMANAKNVEAFNKASVILNFFTSEDAVSVLNNQINYYYYLPYTDATKSISLLTLTDYIRKRLPNEVGISVRPNFDLLNCDSNSCINSIETQLLMGVTSTYADTVFEFYDLTTRLLDENKITKFLSVKNQFRSKFVTAMANAITYFNNLATEIETILSNTQRMTVISISGIPISSLFDQQLLNNYKSYVINLAKLYDKTQELLLYRDAISYAADTYSLPAESPKNKLFYNYASISDAVFPLFNKASYRLKQDIDYLFSFPRNQREQLLSGSTERKQFSWWWQDLPIFAKIITDVKI